MTTTPTPIYLDWTFWSFVTAAIAIVLSQVPPIRQWFTKAKLHVEVYGRLQVSHLLGHPNLGALIGIQNLGGQAARIRSISATVTRNGQTLASTEGRSYFREPDSQTAVFLTPFTLPSKSEWAHTTAFVEVLSQNDDRRLGLLRADVRLSIGQKAAAERAKNPQNPALVETDPELTARMEAEFNQKFIWNPGEYQIVISAHTTDGSVANCQYRFTLYESDSLQLRDEVQRYRQGFFVAIDDPHAMRVFVTLAPCI